MFSGTTMSSLPALEDCMVLYLTGMLYSCYLAMLKASSISPALSLACKN